jgi:hypothetical protein
MNLVKHIRAQSNNLADLFDHLRPMHVLIAMGARGIYTPMMILEYVKQTGVYILVGLISRRFI